MNFVFFVLLVQIILGGLILAKESGMRISIPIDLSSRYFTMFHSFETPYSTFNSFPCSLSSMFCLSGTCWVFTLQFYRSLYSSQIYRDIFYPRLSFYLFCCNKIISWKPKFYEEEEVQEVVLECGGRIGDSQVPMTQHDLYHKHTFPKTNLLSFFTSERFCFQPFFVSKGVPFTILVLITFVCGSI